MIYEGKRVTYEGIERVEILDHRRSPMGGIHYRIRRADGTEEYRAGPWASMVGEGTPLSGSIVVRLRTFNLRTSVLRVMETW